MFERFAIDDGLHLLEIVIDEDASTAAGTARYTARCSCGRMSPHPAQSRQEALADHVAHVNTRLSPKGAGPRSVLLLVACVALGVGSIAGSIALAEAAHLSGASALATRLAGLLVGFGGAAALMVGARRFIAPTRM